AGSLCKRHAITRGIAPHWALTACRHMVSGSVSSPCRGSSHLSLALLGSLSVVREYLALRDGPRGFGPRFTCAVLLRCLICWICRTHTGHHPTVARLSSLYGWTTPILTTGPTTPRRRVPWVWAVPRSLAATDGVAFASLSSGY